MRFFAVGTNMDEARLHAWLPDARRVAVGSLRGFILGWNKRSAEGGKLAPSRNGRDEDVIWGVVYEVDDSERASLEDAQRAAGYRAEAVVVTGGDGTDYECTLYVAPPELLDASIRPTRAYRDPIVEAARANGLPVAYVDALARTPVADD